MSHLPGHIDPLSNNYGFGMPTSRQYAINALDAERTPMNWDTSVSFSDLYQDIQNHPLSHVLPVASTAMHWDDMGALEKTFSTTMDAIDVATLGSGKLITAPIRAATKLATRNKPTFTYLRGGMMPTVASPDNPFWQFTPSINHHLLEPELGISTYQGLKMPFETTGNTAQYYMRPAPLVSDIHAYTPDHYRYGSTPSNTYQTDAAGTQLNVYENRPIYEVGGKPLSTFGADNEALLDAQTAYYKSLEDISNPTLNTQAWSEELGKQIEGLWDVRMRYDLEDAGVWDANERILRLPFNVQGTDAGSTLSPWGKIWNWGAMENPEFGRWTDLDAAEDVSKWYMPIPEQKNIELYMPNHPARFTTENPRTGRKEILPGHRTDPLVTNPRTGKVYNLEEEFAKYDASGTVINPWMRLADNPYISGIRTIPATMPIRGAINEFRDTDPIPSDAVIRSVLGDAGMQAAMLGGIDW